MSRAATVYFMADMKKVKNESCSQDKNKSDLKCIRPPRRNLGNIYFKIDPMPWGMQVKNDKALVRWISSTCSTKNGREGRLFTYDGNFRPCG